jgi:deoxyribonuclease V
MRIFIMQSSGFQWDVNQYDAEQIQLRLAPIVVAHDDFGDVAQIGGVSIRQPDAATVQAAVVILDLPSMKMIESATATTKSTLPYVPGSRAFQSGPAIIAAFEKLRNRPGLVL